jgi:hypothetical protein
LISLYCGLHEDFPATIKSIPTTQGFAMRTNYFELKVALSSVVRLDSHDSPESMLAHLNLFRALFEQTGASAMLLAKEFASRNY